MRANCPFKYAAIALAVLGMTASHLAHAADAVETDSINVFGRGQTRQVTTVTRQDIQDEAPGTSPLKVLGKLPGVSFQSADPYGAYEWSTSISVRGFGSNQLGYTLDDIPLGDMSYGNHNGLHISRAISSENIGRVQLSQGTGALDTASTSNLGGTMQFYSVDPEDQFGGTVAQTLGSNNSRRTFLKLDSGRLENGGKMYLSLADQNSDKWKGQGEQRSKQANFKYVQFLGDSKLSAFVNFSDRREIDYQDLSKEMISRLGYRWDNYYPNWQAAINSSQGIWSSGETSKDDAYYAGAGLRQDTLAGVSYDAAVNENLRWKTTVYNHTDKGQGLWWTPYVLSPTTNTPAVRTTEYDMNRPGLISAMTLKLDAHKVNGGIWYESDDFKQARRYYATSATDPLSPYDYKSNPFRTDWNFNFNERTTQLWLQDTVRVAERTNLNAGFKSVSVVVTGTETTGADRPSGTIESTKPFLPQIGINHQLDESNELFAQVAQNMRAIYTQPFSTTKAGFAAIVGSLQPETSTTYEGGWRFHGESTEGLLTGYYTQFKDRLLSIQQGSGIAGNPSVLANVGKVESVGLEAGLNWKVTRTWSWYNSVSVNDTQYKENYIDNGVVRNVAGKQVVGIPKNMFKTEISYSSGPWFAKLSGDYMSERYYTYSNDASADPRWLWNLGGGYRTKNVWMFKEVTAQVNVMNLFDTQYISTVGTNGFTYSDPNGTSQTLMVGAPRQFFANLTGKF